MNLYKLEDVLVAILEENEAARGDDMTLYAAYVWSILTTAGVEPKTGCLEKVFSDVRYRTIYGIAQFESVSRCRRRIQASTEELRPNKTVVEERQKLIKEYKAYARQNNKRVVQR